MRKYLYAMFAAIMLFVGACSTAITPVINVAEVTEVDLQKVPKKGEDCAVYYLPILLNLGPFGSNSVMKAAKKAGISKVKLVDREYHYNILTFRSCVVVYGE